MDLDVVFGDDFVADTCPACGSKRIWLGHLHGTFRLYHVKSFSLALTGPQVNVPHTACACLNCGLVWSLLDQQALQQAVENWGVDDFKARVLLPKKDPTDPAQMLLRPANEGQSAASIELLRPASEGQSNSPSELLRPASAEDSNEETFHE